MESEKKFVMSELTKAVEEDEIAETSLAVNEVLKTTEEKIRSKVIRWMEGINFDDKLEEEGKEMTLELIEENTKQVATAIDQVNTIEREVARISELVRQVKKKLNITTDMTNETLYKLEQEVRGEAKKAMDSGGEELLRARMLLVMEGLPNKIAGLLKARR